MLQFIDGPDDVLALTMNDKITGTDLDAVMDRLERLLQQHDKVHVFVETRSIEGIELSSLPSYAARAMPLLGKLNHFGRVAVVADQAWIRLGSMIESAILPFISYRVFEPHQRADALAWVTGQQAAA